jgi:membrane protease YdiL (CAAX protease family)
MLLGAPDRLIGLFRPFPSLAALDWQTRLLLWWPIVFPLAFVFIPRLRSANVPIPITSLALGILIGVTEEVLWRGVYLNLFAGNL